MCPIIQRCVSNFGNGGGSSRGESGQPGLETQYVLMRRYVFFVLFSDTILMTAQRLVLLWYYGVCYNTNFTADSSHLCPNFTQLSIATPSLTRLRQFQPPALVIVATLSLPLKATQPDGPHIVMVL